MHAALPEPNKPSPEATDLISIEQVLTELCNAMTASVDGALSIVAACHPTYRRSAENFLHYVTLRERDIRELQTALAQRGLSSLGNVEGYALPALRAVLGVVRHLASSNTETAIPGDNPQHACPSIAYDIGAGDQLLNEHTTALFGAQRIARGVGIMVTMPSEAADDDALIRELLVAGMDAMRINCAHDDAETWLRMIKNLRTAEAQTGRACRVVMDLAGPKLRTGPLPAGPAVTKIRPARDKLGRVTQRASFWLYERDQLADEASHIPAFTIPGSWLGAIEIGDELHFFDARESSRCAFVVEVHAHGCRVELASTAYIVPGTVLSVHGKKAIRKMGHIAPFAPREQAITLKEGDRLLLTRDNGPGRPAAAPASVGATPPQALPSIGCTLPQIFDLAKEGQRIAFDDGKIAGRIESINEDGMCVCIDHAFGNVKLKSDKGINLPDTKLEIPALTESDLSALQFAAQHADIVEMSFVNTAADVSSLLQRIDELDAADLGIVLKIETARGFANLPGLILEGMRSARFGVMIARGDLAVEVGYERVAEIQEEILCLCESAHVPVIWATQVLESLAKKGAPSRAEITDAAMAVRADYVMLNKGPYITDAVRTLDDVLMRMKTHRHKKKDTLRQLGVARLSHE